MIVLKLFGLGSVVFKCLLILLMCIKFKILYLVVEILRIFVFFFLLFLFRIFLMIFLSMFLIVIIFVILLNLLSMIVRWLWVFKNFLSILLIDFDLGINYGLWSCLWIFLECLEFDLFSLGSRFLMKSMLIVFFNCFLNIGIWVFLVCVISLIIFLKDILMLIVLICEWGVMIFEMLSFFRLIIFLIILMRFGFKLFLCLFVFIIDFNLVFYFFFNFVLFVWCFDSFCVKMFMMLILIVSG